MIDAFLVPANTVITAKGDSEPLDISIASSPALLATLSISKVVEQESIEVSFFTSADGVTWEAKPVASLPQKFYVGEYPLLVDLSQASGAKFLRAPLGGQSLGTRSGHAQLRSRPAGSRNSCGTSAGRARRSRYAALAVRALR